MMGEGSVFNSKIADQSAASLGEKCRKPWLPGFPRKAGITPCQHFWLWLRAVRNPDENKLTVFSENQRGFIFQCSASCPDSSLSPVLSVPWASAAALHFAQPWGAAVLCL